MLIIFVFTLSACSGNATINNSPIAAAQPATDAGEASPTPVDFQEDIEIVSKPIAVEYDADDLSSNVSTSNTSYIELEGDTIRFEGQGATVSDNIVTIATSGAYIISGILNNGQIVVDAQDEMIVLVLNGADITHLTNAPIYIKNADKTVITLADGTENTVTDGASYIFDDGETDEPNAAIFSKDDLTINGNGSLTVNANYNNGIASKDDLKITGGRINVIAVNDGIKGRDLIALQDGIINIEAGGDGMQSNNDEGPEKGTVVIDGGTLNITANLDGIQAETRLAVNGGSITISSGGGSTNSSTAENWGNWGIENNPTKSDIGDSAKGLKAGVDITIAGGEIQIDSSDDSIHSNASITINGGNILLASGDDGIHSDSTLEINSGTIQITKSYEGVESATITINNGNLLINSGDDGINAAGGNDGSSINGRPGQNNFELSGDYSLKINGGYIVVAASGDGIDINGSIEMTDGVVIVNGPTSNGNGALDYLGTFTIDGGLMVAAGSAGMAQAPDTSSSQNSVIHNFASMQAAGTIFHVESESGENILTFEPTKDYQSVVVSSPELKDGETYSIFTGGSSSGTLTDGLYLGGIYTPGTLVASFAVSSNVISSGEAGGRFPTGPGGNRPARP